MIKWLKKKMVRWRGYSSYPKPVIRVRLTADKHKNNLQFADHVKRCGYVGGDEVVILLAAQYDRMRDIARRKTIGGMAPIANLIESAVDARYVTGEALFNEGKPLSEFTTTL